jgi:hypothetical protein
MLTIESFRPDEIGQVDGAHQNSRVALLITYRKGVHKTLRNVKVQVQVIINLSYNNNNNVLYL